MTNAPFGNCKAADLSRGDRLQSMGSLLAVDKRTQLICACSANAAEFTGKGPTELLGRHWDVLFRADQLGSLFSPADTADLQLPQIQRAEWAGRSQLVATHSAGDVTIAEIEAWQPENRQHGFADRVGYLRELSQTDTAEQAAVRLMEAVADITGFDRVMAYKFRADWHGEVIAERLKPGVQGYLGLRFPATDLPANARRLYLLNWQRVITDVHAETVALISAPDCPALDLTFSQFRAVHPVHIQYLKNIGVEASFSVSIIVSGKLWGLVACHNFVPKSLSLSHRQLCEEMSRIAALHMTDMVTYRLEQSRSALREQFAEILGALRAQSGDKRALVLQLGQIANVYRADGVFARLDNQSFHSGSVPDDISLSALTNSLETYDKSEIAVRHMVSPLLAAHPALVRFASGSLYLPLTGQDYLLLLRREQVESVRWAGRPQSQEDAGEEILQLTPRASFQAWTETVKGSAEAWDEAEVESAGQARQLLIEYLEKRQLEDMALRDPLTGLANRAMFDRALQEAIRLSLNSNMQVAVFMLDLDKFKPVNDTLGHSAGDELLIQVGNRLQQLMRSRDIVARLGGDEFGIVAYDLQKLEDADLTAARIIQDFRRPFQIQQHSVEIGVSIGVSMCPLHAIERDELLEDADLALYSAKDSGRNTFKSFSNDMLSNSDQRQSVRQSILDAMQNGEMSLVYQPVVNSKTRALQSFESFARWAHPEKGQIPARDFLPVLEQCQLLPQFAHWGIRQVIQQCKSWLRSALPLAPVSLNIDAKQFFSLDLFSLCRSLSQDLEMGLEWLRFDLDETALQSDFARASAKIAALTTLGVLVNIDHFGQGLVQLNRLGEVKINEYKLAGKFFEPTKDDTRNDALIAIVHQVGKVLHVPVVACQIDTEARESTAMHAGMEYLQGYRISRELVPEDAAEWLKRRGSISGHS
jgi:chemotaxis family two-component system sensor kinase Cph1